MLRRTAFSRYQTPFWNAWFRSYASHRLVCHITACVPTEFGNKMSHYSRGKASNREIIAAKAVPTTLKPPHASQERL